MEALKILKITFIFLAILLCIPSVQITYSSSINIEQKPVPAYAKWGRLAMKETKTRYPNAEIVDYLHVGRTTNPDETIEKFKLWLIEGNKEFGVLITIKFATKTEKIKQITFQKTTR